MTKLLFASRTIALEDNSPLKAAVAQHQPTHMPDKELPTSLDAIDEAVDTALTLEAMHGHLTNLSVVEPLKPSVAAALEHAVAHLKRRMGEDTTRSFAVEGFTGRPARREATRIAMESIAETIRNLINKIITWIRHVPARLMDWIADAFKGASVYTRKAHTLQEMAMTAKAHYGNARVQRLLTEGSFVDFFAGHDPRTLLRDFRGTYANFNNHFSGQILGQVSGHLNAVAAEMVRDSANAQYTNEKAAAEADKAILWLQHNAFVQFKKRGDGADLMLPFGQATLHVTYMRQGQYFVGLGITMNKGDAPTRAGLHVLTPDEVVEMTHALTDQMNGGLYKDYLKIKKGLQDLVDTLERACTAIAKRNSANGPGAVASLHFMKLLAGSQLQLIHHAYQYSHRVNAMLTAYCEASLAAYAEETSANADAQHKLPNAANDPTDKSRKVKKA